MNRTVSPSLASAATGEDSGSMISPGPGRSTSRRMTSRIRSGSATRSTVRLPWGSSAYMSVTTSDSATPRVSGRDSGSPAGRRPSGAVTATSRGTRSTRRAWIAGPSSAMPVTIVAVSVTPTRTADEVAAVRRGLRAVLRAPRSTTGPSTTPTTVPSAPRRVGSAPAATARTPRNARTPHAPAETTSRAATASDMECQPNAATAAPTTTIASRRHHGSGRTSAGRIASSGLPEVARHNDGSAVSTVTPMPTAAASRYARPGTVTSCSGMVTPSRGASRDASETANRPRASPAAVASAPTASASAMPETRSCNREAPRHRSSAVSRTRAANTTAKVVPITSAATATASTVNASRARV